MSTPITGISSMATRGVLNDLALQYSQNTGQGLAFESVGGVDAAKRVQAGEVFDIVVLAADVIAKLVADGQAVSGTAVALVQSGVSVAVAAGAALPDISSEAAVRDAVLAAPSIGYSTGPSGVALVKLFERWGVAEQIADRLVQAKAGVPVGALVAAGQVALGFQQLSELIHQDGIIVVGPLPPSIQITTTFSAALCRSGSQAELALAALQFLASAEATAAKRHHGMQPA